MRFLAILTLAVTSSANWFNYAKQVDGLCLLKDASSKLQIRFEPFLENPITRYVCPNGQNDVSEGSFPLYQLPAAVFDHHPYDDNSCRATFAAFGLSSSVVDIASAITEICKLIPKNDGPPFLLDVPWAATSTHKSSHSCMLYGSGTYLKISMSWANPFTFSYTCPDNSGGTKQGEDWLSLLPQAVKFSYFYRDNCKDAFLGFGLPASIYWDFDAIKEICRIYVG